LGAQGRLTRPRVVLDTNCVLSALVFRNGRMAWLRESWQAGHFQPLASRYTVEELLRTLTYPKFQLTAAEREALLADYLPWVESVVVDPHGVEIPEVRDPGDRKFLVLAVAGEADALVTGDSDLLDLADSIHTVAVITPAVFQKRLTIG